MKTKILILIAVLTLITEVTFATDVSSTQLREKFCPKNHFSEYLDYAGSVGHNFSALFNDNQVAQSLISKVDNEMKSLCLSGADESAVDNASSRLMEQDWKKLCDTILQKGELSETVKQNAHRVCFQVANRYPNKIANDLVKAGNNVREVSALVTSASENGQEHCNAGTSDIDRGTQKDPYTDIYDYVNRGSQGAQE